MANGFEGLDWGPRGVNLGVKGMTMTPGKEGEIHSHMAYKLQNP